MNGPWRRRFQVVYALLGLALLAAAVLFGRSLAVVEYRSVPAYCDRKAWHGCVVDAIRAQGAPANATVSCVKVADRSKRQLCDVRLPDGYGGQSCYDLVVGRSKQGVPLPGSPVERKC